MIGLSIVYSNADVYLILARVVCPAYLESQSIVSSSLLTPETMEGARGKIKADSA